MTKEFGELSQFYWEQQESKSSGKPTQEEIGNILDVGQPNISQIFTGARSIRREKAIILAELLEVPRENLIEFFLLAGGYSLEFVSSLLEQSGIPLSNGLKVVKEYRLS